MENMQQTIGRRLRQAREEQGRSREEVEQAITVHAHHLEALERGTSRRCPAVCGRGDS
jgi:cytoskeletal protein RodZ